PGYVQNVNSTALDGMHTTTTVEGQERYPVNIRYARDLRDDAQSIRQVLVPTSTGAHIPLGQLADVKINPGPPMIKSENSRRSATVFIDFAGRDLGSFVKDAQKAIGQQLRLPAGYSLVWSGEYEVMQENASRMWIAFPL